VFCVTTPQVLIVLVLQFISQLLHSYFDLFIDNQTCCYSFMRIPFEESI
jgi:hypothetical protein